MLNKKFAFAATCALGIWACTETGNVAGGVSEETNTVAGILVDVRGKPVSGVSVLAKHATVDSIAFIDTTGEDGRFAFPLVRQGLYGISGKTDSSSFYQTVNYDGKEQNVEVALKRSFDFEGQFVLDTNEQVSGILVSLPGSGWKTETDSLGNFELKGVPEGFYAVQANSPDPIRYLNAAYLLDVSSEGSSIAGPLPASIDVDSLKSNGGREALASAGDQENQVRLPLSTEYGLLSWWPMDVISSSDGSVTTLDARGHTDAVLLYGIDEMVEGHSGKALFLNSSDRFGVVENDRGALDSLGEMTVELMLQIDSTKERGSYRKNIFGKLGFGGDDDKSVFSFALINQDCGVQSPSIAFFLADGSGDSLRCENAVVSSQPIDYKSWTHYVVTWDGGKLSLFKNGVLDASKDVSVKLILPSDEPIFFGKENINIKLDDVRLGAKAITSADVLYRYYLRGGTL